MPPLADTDGSDRISRKAKVAIENARRLLSIRLFDADIPSKALRFYADPDFPCGLNSGHAMRVIYVSFMWNRYAKPGDIDTAVVELTSDAEPVDGCL